VLRILITGMSGVGKSALVQELRHRGYTAYDSDDDGFTEPREHGGWGWRLDLVQALFDQSGDRVLFFSGCSEEQALFHFDLRVLLTAPEAVIVERLKDRTTNSYGKKDDELERVLSDQRMVEPLLKRTADIVIDTTLPIEQAGDLVIDRVTVLLDAGTH
jgi:dephospho-CoA kinase